MSAVSRMIPTACCVICGEVTVRHFTHVLFRSSGITSTMLGSPLFAQLKPSITWATLTGWFVVMHTPVACAFTWYCAPAFNVIGAPPSMATCVPFWWASTR